MPRHIIAASIATLLGLAGIAQAATDFIVMDARGIKLKAGDKIDGDQKLTLLDGQRLTLMAPNGATLKVQGPKDEAPADELKGGSTADVGGALTAMLASNKTKTALGVTRNAGKKELPEPWLVDVSSEGVTCLLPGEAVKLWRPKAEAEGKLTIAPSDRSWQASRDWSQGSDIMAMPPSVPLHDRATYIFNLDGESKQVTLVAIPVAMNNDLMRLGFMFDKGCIRQTPALENAIRDQSTKPVAQR